LLKIFTKPTSPTVQPYSRFLIAFDIKLVLYTFPSYPIINLVYPNTTEKGHVERKVPKYRKFNSRKRKRKFLPKE